MAFILCTNTVFFFFQFWLDDYNLPLTIQIRLIFGHIPIKSQQLLKSKSLKSNMLHNENL